jgi:hypothetical protein
MVTLLCGLDWKIFIIEFYIVLCASTVIFKLMKDNEPTNFFGNKWFVGVCTMLCVGGCSLGVSEMVKKIDRIESAVNRLQNLQINQATRNIIIGKP